MGHLAADVAEVDVGEALLGAVLLDRVVEVALGHLGERAEAKLEHVAGAGRDVDDALIHGLLIDEAGLAAHCGRGRIVGMESEADSGLLGDGQDFFKEALQAAP